MALPSIAFLRSLSFYLKQMTYIFLPLNIVFPTFDLFQVYLIVQEHSNLVFLLGLDFLVEYTGLFPSLLFPLVFHFRIFYLHNFLFQEQILFLFSHISILLALLVHYRCILFKKLYRLNFPETIHMLGTLLLDLYGQFF